MKLKNLRSVFFVSSVSLIVSFCYALARYVLAGGSDIGKVVPSVFNNSLAFTSAILIAVSFLSREIRQKKFFGLVGLCFGIAHALAAFKLFDLVPILALFLKTGKMVFNFELAVLCGIFAISIFLILAFIHNKMLAYTALIFLMWHVLIMGYESWFKVADWPGYLPPITILAFIMIVFILTRGFVVSRGVGDGKG